MDSFLLYFREEWIELWSIDSNGRLIPVMYNSSNRLPLYFLLSGEQILMNDYAKKAYLKNEDNAFGDFWKNLENTSISYERFSLKNSFATLLPNVLKESVLPLVAKSHFHTNLSGLLNDANTGILFDSFVEEENKEIILNLFLEIVGFLPNSITSFDYFNCFREIQTKRKAISKSDSFICVNISCGNFYFHLIGKNSPIHLAKKVLEGKGQDPVLDVVLDFLVEIVQAKGSFLDQKTIKKQLQNDGKTLLSKISEGLVIHTLRNHNLDVADPLKISFHKNDIEGRINNRQSLNFIQNEFDSFRRQNNAEQLPIFLVGSIVNQSVFMEFFKSYYKNVCVEDLDFEVDFISGILTENFGSNQVLSPRFDLENIQTVNNDRTKSNPSVDLHGVDVIPDRKTGLPPLPVKEKAPTSQPIPNPEKEKKAPPIKTGLTIPGMSSQGIGSTSPQTAPVVKAPVSTATAKVEDAPRVQVKPVTPTTVEKFVIPTQVAKGVPPAPEVRLDSKQSLPPKPTIPGLPNSLTLQGTLAKKIQQNYPDAEVKKVDKDNYVDIFIPSVYPKRGAHLFFNTSKDEIKIGFYCRDEEFIKGVLAKQPTLEAYSQGIRPKGNKSYSSVEEGISATLDFLSKMVGKLELPSNQKNETLKVPPPIISVSTNRVPPPPPPPPPIKKK